MLLGRSGSARADPAQLPFKCGVNTIIYPLQTVGIYLGGIKMC